MAITDSSSRAKTMFQNKDFTLLKPFQAMLQSSQACAPREPALSTDAE